MAQLPVVVTTEEMQPELQLVQRGRRLHQPRLAEVVLEQLARQAEQARARPHQLQRPKLVRAEMAEAAALAERAAVRQAAERAQRPTKH